MSTRRLSALVIGLLLAGSSTAPAQAPRTVEQAQAPAGRLGARTQIQVQPRMPNLVGQTFQAAQEDSRVTSLKLQLAAMRRPTAEQRPGVIVDQEPSPGSAVKPGMRVTVFVAVPPDKPPDQGRGQTDAPPRMPNLVGQPFDRAQQDSRVAGLKLRLIPRELPTSGQRPGVIIGHEPKPGDPVRPGSSVVAVVAVAEQKPPDRDGDTVKNVEVPRVVTMQAKDGASLLARRTLNAQAQFTDTSRAEPGTIVDQKPAPGTLVPQNSTVQILVARARPDPPPNQTPDRNPVVGVRVPLVEGLEVRQGLALVSKFNLGARAQVVDTDRAAPGTIIDQNPDAGTLVVPPFTVTVVVARRPPSPPPPEDVKPDDVKPPPPVVPPPPPPPRLFPMPDLVGRSFPQAERDSRVADLQLRLNQQIDTRAGGLPNTIVRQSVSPGTERPDRSGGHGLRGIGRRGAARDRAAGRCRRRTHRRRGAESPAFGGGQRADAGDGAAAGSRPRRARGTRGGGWDDHRCAAESGDSQRRGTARAPRRCRSWLACGCVPHPWTTRAPGCHRNKWSRRSRLPARKW